MAKQPSKNGKHSRPTARKTKVRAKVTFDGQAEAENLAEPVDSAEIEESTTDSADSEAPAAANGQ